MLGNHDGNESESAKDLPAYLDNFFFPEGEAARWFKFRFADLAEFFGLDTTKNQGGGPPAPTFLNGQPQSEWLREELSKPGLPWRIAWMHHPMFTAGPEHEPARAMLRHWFDWFSSSQVDAVFAGHEHNFQFSERSARTGDMQFVVTGAGGQLRSNDIRRNMRIRSIAAWAAQHHFCVVEIDRNEMRITLVPAAPSLPVDAEGKPVSLPLRVPNRP